MKYRITVTQDYEYPEGTQLEAIKQFINDMKIGNYTLNIKPLNQHDEPVESLKFEVIKESPEYQVIDSSEISAKNQINKHGSCCYCTYCNEMHDECIC